MKWVTRERPKTDRIACPWLIRHFIDPGAEFLFAPKERVLEVAEHEGARSFDVEGGEFTHEGNRCTFEVLVDRFELTGDPALTRLARVVHAADISTDLHTDPLGPGLLAIGEGGLKAEPSDEQLSSRGSFVYDALYAWCTDHASDALKRKLP
jgi:hypothetical protein